MDVISYGNVTLHKKMINRPKGKNFLLEILCKIGTFTLTFFLKSVGLALGELNRNTARVCDGTPSALILTVRLSVNFKMDL